MPMKLTDLRALLKPAPKDRLEQAVVEIYKALPKSKKDDLDSQIEDILKGLKAKQEASAPKALTDFPALKSEIETFMEDARNWYYGEPNRKIAKKDRPKWRFKVKRYIRELQTIPADAPVYPQAVDLMIRIHDLLCESCGGTFFSSLDPFRSVTCSRSDLFAIVAKMKLQESGISRETLSLLISMACRNDPRDESEVGEAQDKLLELLPDEDSKRLACEVSRSLCLEKKGGPDTRLSWTDRDTVDNLCEMQLKLSSLLPDPFPLEGFQFFMEHAARSQSWKLSWALRIVDFTAPVDIWVRFYEAGIAMKIPVSDAEKKQYQEYLKYLEEPDPEESPES